MVDRHKLSILKLRDFSYTLSSGIFGVVVLLATFIRVFATLKLLGYITCNLVIIINSSFELFFLLRALSTFVAVC